MAVFKSLFEENLRILGFYDSDVYKSAKISINSNSFDQPNYAGFQLVMYYLFNFVTESKSDGQFKNVYPIITKGDEANFRKICIIILNELRQMNPNLADNLLIFTPGLFMKPCGTKLCKFLCGFSTFAMLQHVKTVGLETEVISIQNLHLHKKDQTGSIQLYKSECEKCFERIEALDNRSTNLHIDFDITTVKLQVKQEEFEGKFQEAIDECEKYANLLIPLLPENFVDQIVDTPRNCAEFYEFLTNFVEKSLNKFKRSAENVDELYKTCTEINDRLNFVLNPADSQVEISQANLNNPKFKDTLGTSSKMDLNKLIDSWNALLKNILLQNSKGEHCEKFLDHLSLHISDLKKSREEMNLAGDEIAQNFLPNLNRSVEKSQKYVENLTTAESADFSAKFPYTLSRPLKISLDDDENDSIRHQRNCEDTVVSENSNSNVQFEETCSSSEISFKDLSNVDIFSETDSFLVKSD